MKVTASATNNKRNDPKTGVKKDAKSTLVEFSSNSVKIDTPFKDNESSIVRACGYAGGDKFAVEVGTDGTNFPQKMKVEDWTK